MAWRTGPGAPLGMANANPTIPDAIMPTGTSVGLVQIFVEDTQGPAELIYLPGVAGLVAGDLVYYDLLPGAQATVRALTAGGANTGRCVAVAVGAPQAGQWGWFQISGVAVVNVTGGANINNPIFTTVVAGAVSTSATAGAQVAAARAVSAGGVPAAGKQYITINRPQMQTQIT